MIEIESFKKLKNVLIVEKFFELRESKIKTETLQRLFELEHSDVGVLKGFLEEKRIKKEIMEKHYDLEKKINEDYQNTLLEIKELKKVKLPNAEVEKLYSKERIEYEDKITELNHLEKKVKGGVLKFAIHEYLENEAYAEIIKQQYPEIEENIESKISYYKTKGKTPEESYALSFNLYLKKEKPNLAKELFAKTRSIFLDNKEKQEAKIGLQAITSPAYALNPVGFVPRKALNGILKTSTFLKISNKISNEVEYILRDLKVGYESKFNSITKKFLICAVIANVALLSAENILVNRKPIEFGLYEKKIEQAEKISPIMKKDYGHYKRDFEYIDPVDPEGVMIKDLSSDNHRKFKR